MVQNKFLPSFDNHVNKEDNTNSSAPPPLDMNSLSCALPQYQALSSHEVPICQTNGMQSHPDILRNGNGMSSQIAPLNKNMEENIKTHAFSNHSLTENDHQATNQDNDESENIEKQPNLIVFD